jgi:hypothetical protein
MNFAYWSSWVFTGSSTRAWIVTAFGCLGGTLVIAMISFRSSSLVLSYLLSYKSARSLLLRGQNAICDFSRKEAEVTAEARRDRAAILRRDGVAPASGRVSAALHFLVISVGSACSLCLLSRSWAEVGGEIPPERCLLGTFLVILHFWRCDVLHDFITATLQMCILVVFVSCITSQIQVCTRSTVHDCSHRGLHE